MYPSSFVTLCNKLQRKLKGMEMLHFLGYLKAFALDGRPPKEHSDCYKPLLLFGGTQMYILVADNTDRYIKI